jgi:uncharacterized membrane protein
MGAIKETAMFQLVLLSLAAALLCASGARAHSVHADCRVGDSRMGVVPHWHPGAYGQAQPCGGGGGGGYRGDGYSGGGAYYHPPVPAAPQVPYVGGGAHRAGDGYRHPQGQILGHGEAVGCAPSFSRVVQGGGSVCREIP